MGNTTTKIKSKKSHNLFIDRFTSYRELDNALKKAGLGKLNLIIGISYTRSNAWNGSLPYYGEANLHSPHLVPNLYQQVISIIGNTLSSFDENKLIPAYGFGDSTTQDRAVFSFLKDDEGKDIACDTFLQVLDVYTTIINKIEQGNIKMSGPTSFVPIINKAIDMVQKTGKYHILLIICDGSVDERKQETINAIVHASKFALSIICIGLGQGPFGVMEEFDDNIPDRNFDNFQFINFYKTMKKCKNQEVEFVKNCLMEIPDQYDYIKNNILK